MDLSVDGARVHMATGGRAFDAGLPTVLLLHGAAMDHTVWALQSRYLAHHGRNVMAVDMPGHGRSGGQPLTGIDAMADWAAKVVAAAGAQRAAIVGHSMGGLVALAAAARHPARVRALVLLGTAYPMAVNETFLGLAAADDHRAIEMMMDWAHGRRAHVGGHSVPGLQLIQGAMRIVERARPGVLHACLKACHDYAGGAAAAAAVGCPVTLVLGAGDLMCPPKVGRRLGDLLANPRIEVLDGVGHMIMSEAPDRLRRLLAEVA